jgi:hypothetical protein
MSGLFTRLEAIRVVQTGHANHNSFGPSDGLTIALSPSLTTGAVKSFIVSRGIKVPLCESSEKDEDAHVDLSKQP